MKPMLLAAAMLLPMPAFAQVAAAPATAQAAPDPARLAAAKEIVARLLPEGIYKRMLGPSLSSMVDSMLGSLGDMPIAQLLKATGISADDAKSLGKGTINEVMGIYDPHWEERNRLVTHALMDGMVDIMATLEPKVRETLGTIYAREFTLTELQDLQRFFVTPTGTHYAGRSMALFMDPEMTKAMAQMMPEIMKAMPDMIGKAMAATKDLPPPRTNKDLTPAERKKIADLLGVDDKTLETDPAK